MTKPAKRTLYALALLLSAGAITLGAVFYANPLGVILGSPPPPVPAPF